MQFSPDSSSVKPTQVSFSAPDAVSHRLINSQPYTGFLLSKMQFYTSSSSGNPTQVPSFNLQDHNSTDNLQMASISPSTYPQSPNGIYKPILDKILSHLQMEFISPSSYPTSLQMAFVSPFPPPHCWHFTMWVQISGHSSVQSSSTFGSRKACKPTYILRFKKIEQGKLFYPKI